MPIILAFDTATQACSVALSIDGSILSRFELTPKQHSARLLPLVGELLSESGMSMKDIDVVAFTRGPGSFMGVRLATGFAQGLAFGIGAPVISLSTLHVLAQTAYERCGVENVLPAWDARMDALYWAGYSLDANGLMQSKVSDQLTSADKFEFPQKGPWHAVGNAWDVYSETLGKRNLDLFLSIQKDIYPNATAMIPLAMDALGRGDVQDPIDIEPVYLRNRVVNN